MRRTARTTILAISAATILALTATACGTPETTALRQIQPGQTVFINAWDGDEDEGDRAQVEKKPSGLWVLPAEATFRKTSDKNHDVKVTLTKDGQWVIEEQLPANDGFGYDGDDCLAKGELYATLKFAENKVKFAKGEKPHTSSNDDCVRGGDKPSSSKH